MLRSAKELKGYVLLAEDGEIGRCKDFLFDDEHWTVRYMVADTAKWLPGRKVLISPISLGPPDWASSRFPVRLTKAQIKEAPELDDHAPVSRQYEMRYFRHYHWPVYWGGAQAWGPASHAAPLYGPPPAKPAPPEPEESADDKHLRSMTEVARYSIENSSEKLGSVEDFIVEDGSWTIRYLVVDTGRWLPGRKVLVPPTWIEEISWKDSRVGLWLTREEVKASPPYDPATPVNREYEAMLYDYYGRPSYWANEASAHVAGR